MVKGYKVFNPDFTCRGFQYEVGKDYKLEGRLEVCRYGFHFCEKVADCFNYYDFDPDNKVAEVEALGEIAVDGDKSATNHIRIVREITWQEMLELANEGKANTGLRNTGDSNTGHRNTGDSNTGHRNTGHRNTGHRNTGHRNTGHWNTGHSNTGHRNTGDSNTGHWNTGDSNTGHWNTGDSNTGHWNKCDHSSGFLCNETPSPTFFNKPTELTWDEVRSIDVTWILRNFKTSGEEGFKEHNQQVWDGLITARKAEILNLPNFDAVIFEDITGVRV